MPRDRSATGAVEGGEHGALGANTGGGSGVMKRIEELPQGLVGGTALESERALAYRRKHDFARQDLGRKLSLAEPFEAAQREHQRIDLTGVQLADPRVHIAADRNDRQIRSLPQQLGLAPQGSRPDPRTLWQSREVRRLRRQKRVARVVACQHTRNRQPLREPSLQILQGMHRQINLPGDQRLLDLLDEQALAADLGEQPVLHPVAGRADRHDLDRSRRGEFGASRNQSIADEGGLAQRHRAAAGPDAEMVGRH